MKKICRTCKYANFPMTRHNPPRVKDHCAGTCGYFSREENLKKIDLPLTHAIYAKKDYIFPYPKEECPVWEENNG